MPKMVPTLTDGLDLRALELLEEGSGSQWDAKLVPAFTQMGVLALNSIDAIEKKWGNSGFR